MARKRMVDPDFWLDEKLGTVTRDERLLFMGLISNADDEGRGRANCKLLKSTVFPYDEDLSGENIRTMLLNLAGLKIVTLYEADNQEFYFLPNFLKHQALNRPTKSKLPAPPNEKTEIQQKLTEDSLSTHGVFNEDSLSTHSQEKRIEENRREVNKDLFMQIKNLRQRYDSETLQVIDNYLDILRTTRVSGKIADSVILKIYTEMTKHPPVVVKSACLTVINSPSLHDKKENYFFGILRNTKADEAVKRINQYQSTQEAEPNPAYLQAKEQLNGRTIL